MLVSWNGFANATIGAKPLKVGFIMVESVSDWGWNWAHNQGRLYLESKLGTQVQTTMAENVPESAEVERVMEKMIAQGVKLIFATSYGYLEPAWRVAARHPDVIIMHCGRVNPHPMKNIGSYGICFGNYVNPDYVAGLVAGRMTKSNEIGYVGGHPVPALLLTLNAFTLGVRSVNPKAKVHVVWTNSWHDPPTEAEAAKGLIDKGVDVLSARVDSTLTIVETAEKNHIYSVAPYADLRQFAPKGWLTGNRLEWGPLYVRVTKSVLDHTWQSGDEKCNLNNEYGKLSSFGPAVPNEVQQEATVLLKEIEQGKFAVFKGPMKDRDGKERIPAGKIVNKDFLGGMNWAVCGVEGAIPKN